MCRPTYPQQRLKVGRVQSLPRPMAPAKVVQIRVVTAAKTMVIKRTLLSRGSMSKGLQAARLLTGSCSPGKGFENWITLAVDRFAAA